MRRKTSKKEIKLKFKRRLRKFRREFRYYAGMGAALVAVLLIFVAAYFMVHGGSLKGQSDSNGGGFGNMFDGGVNSPNGTNSNDGMNFGDSADPHVGANSDKVGTSIAAGTMEVHFIDVGQGDATLVRCGDKAMLIDAGDNSKGTMVQAYLESQGITKLDYVIGTHPDSDHIGGLDVILYKFDCETILMPDKTSDTSTYRDVLSAMKSKSYKQTVPEVGQQYSLGDAIFTIIAPNDTYDDSNDASLGIILKYGQKSFLFTGDAESQAEADIVANGINIACDVYKAGHHGSRSSSSEMLLNAVTPAYAVISCGEGNSYGHPHASVLNSLRTMGVKVFRTDEQGTIVATTDGKDITWNCAPTDSWKAGN